MAVKTDPYTFVNGTVADGLEVNARFDRLYTLQDGEIDSDNMNHALPLKLNSTVKLILDADGDSDNFWYEKSADLTVLSIGGTEILSATASKAYIPTNATFHFDGGTTYSISHPTATSYLQIATGSDNFFRFSNGSSFSAINTAANSNAELGVSNDASYFLLRIDGGDNDHFKMIQYSGSEKERIESGLSGSNYFWNIKNTDANGSSSLGIVNNDSYFVFKIDGSDNDYLKIIQSSSGDKERIESGLFGSDYFWNIKNTDTNGIASLGLVNDASHFVFKIDGADNDYLKLINGSDTEIWEVTTTGELLLPDVDPPTANYLNLNSGLKASAHISVTSASSVSSSQNYNISSFTASSWIVTINFDTDFSTSTYSCVANQIGTGSGPMCFQFGSPAAGSVLLTAYNLSTGTAASSSWSATSIFAGVQ